MIWQVLICVAAEVWHRRVDSDEAAIGRLKSGSHCFRFLYAGAEVVQMLVTCRILLVGVAV